MHRSSQDVWPDSCLPWNSMAENMIPENTIPESSFRTQWASQLNVPLSKSKTLEQTFRNKYPRALCSWKGSDALSLPLDCEAWLDKVMFDAGQ